MESNTYIVFKKQRDLGSIINDTFKFLKENWKSYFSTIFKISAPAIVVFLLSLGFYLYSFSGMFPDFEQQVLEDNNQTIEDIFPNENVGLMIIAMIVFSISAIASYALLNSSAFYAIKSYIKNKGTIHFEEVRTDVKQNFWSFVGLGFLVGLILVFSAFLCFFPVIYTGVVLFIAFPILTFENKGVAETISHCFTLIKDYWLPTFGVVVVLGILVYVLSLIFSIPIIVYQFSKMFSLENNPTAVFSLFKDPIYLGLNMFSYVGQFILSSITLIASAFVYFDLNERKNLTGMIDEIEGIGSSN